MSIPYYDNQINHLLQYLEQQVLPYWNDPIYFEWVRNEYQRCNNSIRFIEQNKMCYQSLMLEFNQIKNISQNAQRTA
jgi:hypothetical protein